MSQLIKIPETAQELREYLQQQAEKGYEWVVYDTDNHITSQHDLHCFPDEEEALDFAREYQQIFSWHEALPIDALVAEIIQVERSVGTKTNNELTQKKETAMNLSNLEDRQYDTQDLGFSKETITKMTELMEKGIPAFTLYESKETAKGIIDYRLHYKKSNQSDFYYFNKFDVTLDRNQYRTPETHYMVISPAEEEGKALLRKFNTAFEAIEYFKQKVTSELSIGKDIKSRTPLAKIENGTIIYTERSFRQTFSQPPLPQTFYIDSGKAFTKEQAGNLIIGNAVYRDDMLNVQGMRYQAWITLNFDKPRDRYGNFPLKQYNDPAYGYNLSESLSDYRIKEMETPEGKKKLENTIKNGNTPLVTVVDQNNQQKKVIVENAVRFRTLNFSREDGKPEKREQFLKEGRRQTQQRSNTIGLEQQQNKERVIRMAR